MISERSYERIEKKDLEKLLKLAIEDREDFFTRYPRWKKLYSNRIICIALCQGAANTTLMVKMVLRISMFGHSILNIQANRFLIEEWVAEILAFQNSGVILLISENLKGGA